MAKISLVQPTAAIGRKVRTPRHSFATKQLPYEITPFFFAPVLPGETMKSLQYLNSVRSGFLQATQSGWWHETMFFYVKHRDLQDAVANLLIDMHVRGVDLEPAGAAADANLYYSAPSAVAGTYPFLKAAMQVVVEHYFRHENETHDVRMSPNGRYVAAYQRLDLLDSASYDTIGPADENELLPDAALIDQHNSDTNVLPGFEAHHAQWKRLRAAGYIEVDFEDYLRAHGISVPVEDATPDRPELLRYIKDWQLPAIRQHPDTLEETATVKWALSETATKSRFFKEPGFLLGVSVIRPKVFLNQSFSLIGHLKDSFSWLPQLLHDRPETSLRMLTSAQAAAAFPSYEGAEGIWIDFRDLFLYGEQFVTGLTAAELAHVVNVCASPYGMEFSQRYPADADIQGHFFATDGEFPPVARVTDGAFISEGIAQPSILSRIRDLTPGNQMAGIIDNG